MQIKEKINLLPTSPGVYRFLDENGTIIYVGKAVNLRRRVSSYFLNLQSHSIKVRALVSHISDIEHTIVENEIDALLLENNLIKKYQPHYNILLKDSKTYPWIVITSEPFPRIYSTRKIFKARQEGEPSGEYFGPYGNSGMQKTILALIRELFPIRNCRLNLTKEDIEKGKFSVCLEYHMKNCMGCCIGAETQQEYLSYINNARKILKGNLGTVREFLTEQMQNAAAELKFEEAEKIRKRLILLENYSHRSIIVSTTLTRLEVVNILTDGDSTLCNHMHIEEGAVTGSYTFEMKSSLDESPEEILAFAISNIEIKSKEIVVPFIPYEDPRFTVPQRGDKLKLLELSLHNCKEELTERLKYLKNTDPEQHTDRVMQKMKEELMLPSQPRHIECFDNSNLQGTSPVASCVVFRDGAPSKKEYRHFNIKTVIGANDFASMHEIVLRRYKRLLEENQQLPDLIVIDGGKGQLSFAYETLKELGLQDKIPIVGLAKKMEEIFRPGISEPLFLDKRGETLRILMHIRDESHRFGITFHRKKRSDNFIKSQLDDIPGLGKKSIEKLMRKFHTIKKIKEASDVDIENILGKDKTAKLKEWIKNLGIIILAVISLTGCTGNAIQNKSHYAEDTLYNPKYAQHFVILKRGDTTLLRIKDPWQNAENIEKEYTITEPYKRIIALSTSHLAFLNAIGCQEKVVGVSDKRFIYSKEYRDRDDIQNVGSEKNPDYEKILSLKSDAMIVYEIAGESSSTFAKLESMGINIIYVGEYLESSALGRAEWITAFGALTGKLKESIDYFTEVESNYNNIKKINSFKGKIILNSPFSDTWFFPEDESYVVKLIEDAGGEYVAKNQFKGKNARPVTMETAYKFLIQADIWLNPSQKIDSFQELENSDARLKGISKRGIILFSSDKRSLPSGGTDYYESGVVRPDIILKDLKMILKYRDNTPEDSLYYYRRISIP